MFLTDAERVDVRRYCGYPLYGNSSSGYQGYRFFQAYGALEYRMTNVTDNEITVIRAYLTNITALDAAIVGASDNLDTDVAAVWVHNKKEVADRDDLFTRRCKKLCDFLGVPFGPGMLASSSVQLVV